MLCILKGTKAVGVNHSEIFSSVRYLSVILHLMVLQYALLLGGCYDGSDRAQQRVQSQERVSVSTEAIPPTRNIESEEGQAGEVPEGGDDSSDSDQLTKNSAFIQKTISLAYGSDSELSAYFVRSSSQYQAGPGLLLLHGMTGMTEDFRTNMKRFAEKGYRVLAPDFFGGRIPLSKADAQNYWEELRSMGKGALISLIASAGSYLFQKMEAKTVSVVGWDEGAYWAQETVLATKKQFRSMVAFGGSPLGLKPQVTEIPIPMMYIVVQDDPEIDIKEVIELENRLETQSPKPVIFRKFHGVSPDFLDPSVPEAKKDQQNIRLGYQLTFEFLQKYSQ